ncbi:MAG TPA: hypothetical protein VN836_00670, partial [Verrucomicrobiae bacterium]|nr:hypothetical protein [Verrucomicrobiae bacterium]
TKTRRIANLLTITANHREIWKEFLNNPKLQRVRNPAADTVKQPVTDAEQVFVNLVIRKRHAEHLLTRATAGVASVRDIMLRRL